MTPTGLNILTVGKCNETFKNIRTVSKPGIVNIQTYTLSTWEAEVAGRTYKLGVQPELQSTFQATQSYIVRPASERPGRRSQPQSSNSKSVT